MDAYEGAQPYTVVAVQLRLRGCCQVQVLSFDVKLALNMAQWETDHSMKLRVRDDMARRMGVTSQEVPLATVAGRT